MKAILRTILFATLFGLIATGPAAAQRKKKNDKAAESSAEDKKPKKGEIQPYSKVITKDAETDEGLFSVHRVDDKYFYEIPDSLFNRDMLMVSRISKAANGIGYGGSKISERVLRWVQKDKKVYLTLVSYRNFADDSLPIHQAVVNSNFEPIIFGFDIKAKKKDSLAPATVIEVGPLFTEDVQALGMPGRLRDRFKVSRVDNDRSYIESIKSYPLNLEARHVKTYAAKSAPEESEAIGSISVEFNNSMILLPEVPMKRRYFDQRVGFFTDRQIDYGLDNQKSETVRYITRWRLEVKEEDKAKFLAGELVEPKKPIVYYIDPSTPKKWVPYLKQGVEDWQSAFEEAGFKNAILAKDAPTPEEDPEWSPEDARYSVIRYLATTTQNAMGPSVTDPRSGEILESDIQWYHNVMNLLRNWFFIQTSAINPDAQGVEFKNEVMGRLIRFVSAHEVGHTLGFPHNMGSSPAYPVDSLRSASFTKKYGTAPSIMDYARFNYVAQPGDQGVNLMPDVGVYDKYATNWGYRPILDKTSEEEKEILNQWILKHAGDPMYRFGRQQRGVLDPSSQTEDLGDDAVKASDYGIANLKRIVPNLIKWTREDGKDYEDLEELYGQVLGQYNRYMGHVVNNIGGVYENFKTYDQSGTVYTPVSQEHQKNCMDFLHRQLFQTPAWMLDKEILGRIEGSGAVERIRGVQVRTLNQLLDVGRMARLTEHFTLNGSSAYSLLEMVYDLRRGLWSELRTGKSIDTYRRNLQKAHIDRLGYLMTAENQREGGSNRTSVNTSQSDIRSVARAELTHLKGEIEVALKKSPDIRTRYHLQDAIARIDAILDPK